MDYKFLSALREGDINQLRQLSCRDCKLFAATTPQGNTVLHMAATLGNESMVQQILDIKPSLLYNTNLKRETPLHIAAKAGKASVVKVFIAANSASNQERIFIRKLDSEGNTPLHGAVKNNHEEVVKVLVEENQEAILLVNAAGESPLSLAINARLTSIACFIIKKNPTALEHKQPYQQTLLHSALQRADYDVVVEIMKAKRELINKVDKRRRNPIHYAAASGDDRSLQYLLEIDASLAYQSDCDGQTPIHLATENQQLKAFKILLKYCPDAIEQLNNEGQNILHLAAKNGANEIVEHIIEQPEMEDLINSPDKDGNTPLHIAAKFPHGIEVTKVLLGNNKVNIWATNKNQQNALDLVMLPSPSDEEQQQKLTLQILKVLLKEAYANRKELDQFIDVSTIPEEDTPTCACVNYI